jgi:Uma2 family endonuclease
MKSKPQAATYDDLVRLPDDRIGEIVGGDLYASPRPRPRHGHAIGRLLVRLATHFDDSSRRDRWWFLFEPELHLGDDVLVPDLAAWRTPEPIATVADAFITTPPDWLCEVLSPSTSSLDQTIKLPAFASHGVRWLWLVEPEQKWLEALTLDGSHWRSTVRWSATARLTAPPFEELELDLSDLWLR